MLNKLIVVADQVFIIEKKASFDRILVAIATLLLISHIRALRVFCST